MILAPGTDYRYAFKRGMTGTDVAALQINLPPLVVDGVFGGKTEKAVKKFQIDHGLTADGIAGLRTQEVMIVSLSNQAARNQGLPTGLLKSISSNESGFSVAAVSRHPSDAGLDVGPYQLSSGSSPGSQEFYIRAYSVVMSSEVSAESIRHTYDGTSASPVDSQYLQDLADGDVSRFRWLMAILSHNWPAAAQNIPLHGLIYPNSPGADDDSAQWIITASGGRISTPREWVASYVERSTVFVRWP